MTASTLLCFKNEAESFLQQEIDAQEDSKLSIGNITFSAKEMATIAKDALIKKGPRGSFKSVADHIADMTGNTSNFLTEVQKKTFEDLKDFLYVFNTTDNNKISDSITATYNTLLSGVSSSSSIVYELAKNSSKKNSDDAKTRISLSNQIINIINRMTELRADMLLPAIVEDPLTSAEHIESNLSSAKSLLTIVLSGLDANSGAKITRREASYNKSMELMSDSLDEMKIGAGQFLLSEYMKLRLDLKVLIGKFEKIDIDINDTINNFVLAETDYISRKDNIGNTEAKYVKEVFDMLSLLLDHVRAVLKKNNNTVTLDQFNKWSIELLSIYTIAHSALDKDTEQSLESGSTSKDLYKVSKTSYESIQPYVSASALVGDLKFLADLYFSILRSTTYTALQVSEKEKDIISRLVKLSQYDQQLVDINQSYTPTITDILAVLMASTNSSGLDVLNSAISTGNVGKVFDSLTKDFGSTAYKASVCLKDSIADISDVQLKETLLNVNAKIQAIQRNRQIAGSVSENLSNDSIKSIDSDIQSLKQLKGQLQGIK
jgi:hypothetical protein